MTTRHVVVTTAREQAKHHRARNQRSAARDLLHAYQGKLTPKLCKELDRATTLLNHHHGSAAPVIPMTWLAQKRAKQQQANKVAEPYWLCSDRSCDHVNLRKHQWCAECGKPRANPKPKGNRNEHADAKKIAQLELKVAKLQKVTSPKESPTEADKG